MTARSIGIRFTALALAVALTACRSSSPPTVSASSSTASKPKRYELEQDVPALEKLDLAKVKPVVPKVEPRTQAGNRSPYVVDGHTYRVLQNEAGFKEEGIASWYGRKFHGHLTSNGELYDMFQLSAAHKTLPIPSYVKVTNLDNGKNIVVRVNDRGPFHDGRVIDMSYAAAVMLGYAGNGTAHVKVEAIVPDGAKYASKMPAPVETSPPAAVVYPPTTVENVAKEREMIEQNKGADYLQIGAFASETSAHNLQARLQAMTKMPVVIHTETSTNGKSLFKVRVGPLADDAQVQAFQDKVAGARLGTPFKVRI
ncbi:MAG TPA: septal ring lytic transglycosylase RlpA family protein [Candidatus Acidoferrum sp.]|nr:septal ring lytic transglycosylase RlpA family protein [Candidatus Acidoferrum sp.]